MSLPRIIVRGATTSICRRTSFRKAFLAPWHPMVDDIWQFALADAARVHDVALHLSVRMPNHHHTDVTPRQDNLPAFAQQLHRDVSCAIKMLMEHERYEPPQDFWDGRDPHYLRLVDPAAQAAQLIHDYVNPPAAGLVTRPEHMPGQPFDWGLWKGEGIVKKRPPIFFDRTRPSELLLDYESTPWLMHSFAGDLDALVHHMRRLSRDALRDIHRARKGRPPVGAQKLQRLHPYDEPRTPAEPKGQRIPTFRIGARGPVGEQRFEQARSETTAFRHGHEACRQERLEGDYDVAFPHGTYAMRVVHRAKVAEPDPEALLTQPGPLLHEILEDLENGPAPSVEERNEMLQEVRSSWKEEVDEVVARDELNFRETRSDEPTDAGPDERPDVETVHQSDPRKNWRVHPRRTVTRRDTRRGRPPKKRGTDPPKR